MEYFHFPNGDSIPLLGLGTWKAAPGVVYEAVRNAIKIGYRHIDCASIYGNEADVGKALRDAIAAGDVSRAELWITSKLWNDCHLPETVSPALRRSLTDLGLDYLDLFLIHWPVAFAPGVTFPRRREDYLTLEQIPLQQTWEALHACLSTGLVRHVGVSNFSQRKLEELVSAGSPAPEVNQVEMHPLLSQKKLLDYCQQLGMLVTAYSPLGSGDRAPAYRGASEPDLLVQETIVDIAREHPASAAQVLLAWALNRGVAVIPKAVQPAHQMVNLQATELKLTDDDTARINALDQHYRFLSGTFLAGKNSPYTVGGIWDEGY